MNDSLVLSTDINWKNLCMRNKGLEQLSGDPENPGRHAKLAAFAPYDSEAEGGQSTIHSAEPLRSGGGKPRG